MEQIPIYIFTFIALYTQVYLFIVLFEEWDTIFATTREKKLKHFPNVVIAVPCWNESKTLEKTVKSLLALEFPKDKLKIWIVDDGSSDNTWEVIQNCKKELDKNNQLEIRTKENGGKHTVLNFVLEQNPDCEIFGCLDADSYVLPDTLKNMLIPFEDVKVMAATPMLVVRKPENLLQAIQSVEYNFGLLLKRIFSAINGIHVTPGPFSLFRREVFHKIGGYKPAHNTEDMEITFRMQKNHMKIVSAVDAYVETSTPNTVYKLYRQRLRWTQGFMQNSIDYKDMIFRPKYGNVAMLTIPLGWIGITMVIYMAGFWIYTLIKQLINVYYNWQALGLDMFTLTFSWQTLLSNIYFETGFLNLLAIPVFSSGLIFIIAGHNLSLMDSRKRRYIFYFIFLWEFLIPLWFIRALLNVVLKRGGQWR
jgi:cellulose synthase/poly-beta-1,6-N-acetylglucosamine synthase-like glycosyltransferase